MDFFTTSKSYADLKDSSPIGKKMLEKMNWSDGDGLGKKNQGMKDPIKPEVNLNNKGLGYKKKCDEAMWQANVSNYESILDSLKVLHKKKEGSDESDDNSEDVNDDLMPQKLNINKKRLHNYKSFIKSKDLSQFSKDELACVIGPQKLKSSNEEAEFKSSTDNAENDDRLQQVVSGQSMKEYFCQKMAKLKQMREEGILGGRGSPSDLNSPAANASKDLIGAANPLSTPMLPDLVFEPARQDFSFNVSASGEMEQQKENNFTESVDHEKENEKKKENSEGSSVIGKKEDVDASGPLKKKKKTKMGRLASHVSVKTLFDNATIKKKKRDKKTQKCESLDRNEVEGNKFDKENKGLLKEKRFSEPESSNQVCGMNESYQAAVDVDKTNKKRKTRKDEDDVESEPSLKKPKKQKASRANSFRELKSEIANTFKQKKVFKRSKLLAIAEAIDRDSPALTKECIALSEAATEVRTGRGYTTITTTGQDSSQEREKAQPEICSTGEEDCDDVAKNLSAKRDFDEAFPGSNFATILGYDS